ncbi:MAG: fluoride efflux transporter CrcB [Paraglaciecola sp.]|uniref:fluoride efflux transporter CrcB n=2 Tax=Pseudomonadati TaxID=3379134 RepID=UPI00273DE4BC|nr:fluoride efflux transporter CrcB [Paraglaciecola sp.]MDP5031058.1 fluoride efflux transporter CrcB [Paraglaciecola sp.]MDP5131361.1 fluoride efflux transporter CrcB [Paraglaciecola sp.]
MQGAMIYLYIAVGGASGACMRYFLSQLIFQWFGKGFPFGTLVVNVLGSFSLGLLYSLIEHGQMEATLWRATVGIGFLGAFTTFSTFSVDTLYLLQQGLWVKGILNMFLNMLGCLLAAWLGTIFVTFFVKG